MSYIALYRKWRPLVFQDVVEQEHVVKTLKTTVEVDRVAHAYLFCGTRGTGKTTMAKIFSRAINCLAPLHGDPCNECENCKGILSGSILDVIEIDAASNNSVDNVREIRDDVVYAATKTKYKVYIIDEVHMLSQGAFNALLKTLEEPPSGVVFILATTEPHKLPATILSRCQRYDFRRISVESIALRVEYICEKSEIVIQKEASRLIAKMADGALRDALSILDQCISLGSKQITLQQILLVVGIVNDSFMGDVAGNIIDRDISAVIKNVDTLVMDGKDLGKFISDLVVYFRNMLVSKVCKNPEDLLEVSQEQKLKLFEQSKSLESEEITYIIKELSTLELNLKWANHPKVLTEVVLIKMCEGSFFVNDKDVLDRLSILEKKLESGAFSLSKADSKPLVSERNSNTTEKVVQKQSVKEIKPVSAGKEIPFWNEIIQKLKSYGRMNLFSNLVGSKAIEMDERFVGIIFDKHLTFAKNVVMKAENLEVLEQELSLKFGRDIKIKSLDSSDEKKPKTRDELIDKFEAVAKKADIPIEIINE